MTFKKVRCTAWESLGEQGEVLGSEQVWGEFSTGLDKSFHPRRINWHPSYCPDLKLGSKSLNRLELESEPLKLCAAAMSRVEQ